MPESFGLSVGDGLFVLVAGGRSADSEVGVGRAALCAGGFGGAGVELGAQRRRGAALAWQVASPTLTGCSSSWPASMLGLVTVREATRRERAGR